MQSFHKNLSKLGWEEVEKRQLHRVPLADEWIELLQLKRGDSVLDIGPGPGVFTLRYAEAVGTSGKVAALEKSKEAANYLLKRLSLTDTKVEVIVGDAERMDEVDLDQFDTIMLTDILHHADSPNQVLKSLYNYVDTSHTRILIAEFDPESKGEFGPPLDKRLNTHHLIDLLGDTGFKVISTGKQLFEHYYIIVHK